MKNPPVRSILVAVASLVLGACESGMLPAEGGEVAVIRIAPEAPRLELSDTLRLNASLLDATGNALNGRRLFWTSENRSVATVSEDGEVTGVGTGSTRVAASADGQSGLVTVDVLPRSVRRVAVTPSRASLFVGETTPLTAAALDRTDRPLEGRALTWSSADTSVATVGSGGVVTGKKDGVVAIRATAEGVTGEATITVARVPVATVEVTPPSATLIVGESRRLTATPRAANGSALDGRDVAWSTSNPGVVTVSGDGVASAVGVGVAVVTALVEGKTGAANLSVSVTPVVTVELSPPSAQLFVGSTQQFTATPKAADGAVLTGRSLTWSVADPATARVDANGLVTAVAPGQTTVTATVEGKSGSAVVTVTRAPVATVEVAPVALQMLAGTTRQLVATARDAAGRELTGREVSWTTSAAAVATVNQSGLVSGVSGGPATITATVEGKSGSASVVVSGVPVATVEVSPPSAAIFAGVNLQLTATLRAGDGSVLTGRVVSWTSSAPGVASVSPTGVVTGQAAGQATITATSEGVTGSASVSVTVPPVATVDVTPSTATIPVGATQQLTATLRASDGTVITGRPITWATSAPTVATVSTGGLVTGVAAGSATITATSEGKSDGAAVTVVVPVATVDVTPGTATVTMGGTQQFTATPRSASGQALTGRTVTWTSSAPTVASVSTTGLVNTLAEGQATITATSEGKSGSGSITVTPVPVATVEVTPTSAQVYIGGAQQLTVTLRSASGAVITGRPVTWSSSGPAVATVSNGGLVTGVAAGQATITATSEGKSDGAAVTVLVPVATVDVTPAAATVTQGGTQQFTATPRSASGQALTGRTVTWTSSAPTVASVSTTGLVNTLAEGQATITATSEGKSGSGSITVTPVPVATVEVTPTSAQVYIGGTQQLTVTLRSASGAVITGRPVTWSSSGPAVATVSNGGLVTGVAAGQVTVTATSEGKSDGAAVTVLVPVATVDVTPTAATVTVGGTQQFTATPRSASGQALTGRTVTWTSSAPTIASVSTTGLVNTLAAGQATITATSEGKSGSGSITVTPAPVATVEVTPTSAQVYIGGTQQLAVTLRSASGAVLTGRTVTWSSSQPAVAGVNSSGLVTGVAAGGANITATSEGKNDAAGITVLAPVATVTVSPSSLSVKVGEEKPLSATLKAADGSTLNGRTVTWSSSNPLVAVVSSTGRVTGVLVGSATITATSEGKTGSAGVTVTAGLEQQDHR